MMPTLSPQFVREGNQVLAFFEGQLIASGTNFAKVEESAVDYLDKLTKHRESAAEEKKKAAATRIETPNGLEGTILGRHEGQWGEKLITVRLENGRIARYEAHAGNDKGIQYKEAKQVSADSALQYLEDTLNEVPEGTKESLASRLVTLDDLVTKAAATLQTKVSHADEKTISNIVIAAEHEKREVKEALDHLHQADAESFTPPAPYNFGVSEQADLGRSSASWLDDTINSMVSESEGQDFDRLLSEEPVLFVAGLETGTLGDAGVTQEMAVSHIVAKTAGFQGDDIEAFRTQFLTKVETARRDELKDRKETAKEQAVKTAKKEQLASTAPDEVLFL